MQFSNKRVRYAYWLFLAFVKKNAQSILLSFLVSLLAVISIVSFSPYILKLITSRTQTIGIMGEYSIDTLPDEVVSRFSNGLLYINDKGEVIPLLVESWEPLQNGKTYQFHLKKDLVWNDGKPFTAKDITFRFKDVKVKVDNNYLITFELPKELPIFPVFLTKPVVKYPLVGVAGLYKVEKIRVTAGLVQELQLTPNQDGLPIIIYKFYDTDTKLIEAYKLGEITEMSTTRSNIADTFSTWKNTNVEKTVDYTRVMALFFNLQDPLLKSEKDLRHAIAESINKEHFAGDGIEASSPIPPISWAHETDTKRFTYNPNVSSKILKKYTEEDEASGSADMKISTFYDHLELADEIKGDLEDAGMNARVEVLTGNLPTDFKIFLAQLTLSKDPDQYFFWHSTQTASNITSYKNVRVDKLLEDGRATFNLAKRKDIYSDFQKVLVDDMPAYFLYYPYTYTIKRK
jgi:peptide/nickel transport system substrate-binding protein